MVAGGRILTEYGNHLSDRFFYAESMQAVFSDQQRVQAMLDFEAALARAGEKAGIVPSAAAATIQRQCRAELFSIPELAEAVTLSGNPAIPLIKSLERLITEVGDDSERYLHLGATSQDVMDTGLILQLRDALDLLEEQIKTLGGNLAVLARQHEKTVLVGRTWLQHAPPVTLGMKISSWLGAVTRHYQRLREMRPRLLCLQFGGASGTLAALGEQAWPVTEYLAKNLKLVVPEQPWHTQRDRLAEFAGWLGSLAGSLGKVGRDISLLMQTELGEVFEPSLPGKGGSSTMPHKRNPVGAAMLISTATRAPGLVATMLSAMPQEHERSLGLWHAEWETLPELCKLVSGALEQAGYLAGGLEINERRMSENLQCTRGLILAESLSIELAKHLGRHRAHELLEECCKAAVAQNQDLLQVALANSVVNEHIGETDIRRLMEPTKYLGQSSRWVRQAIREYSDLFDRESIAKPSQTESENG